MLRSCADRLCVVLRGDSDLGEEEQEMTENEKPIQEMMKVMCDDWESLTPEEQEARMYAVMQAFVPVFESMLQVLVPIVNQAITEFKRLWEAILHTYPNKRVAWLATHHPKERVRKKNRNRICKWINLQYKREGGESND